MEPHITIFFNPSNLSFVYVRQNEDSSFSTRSSGGKWADLKVSLPHLDTIEADYQAWKKSGQIVTENDVKVDNASQIVVDPKKEEKTEDVTAGGVQPDVNLQVP